MVEPISLALISGAAGIGLAVGRLTRSTEDKAVEVVPTSPRERPRSKLQFYAVVDEEDPTELVEQALYGDQVFINIKKMITATDRLYRFLHQLKLMSAEYKLQLHQITKELLLLTRDSSAISVKRLQKLAEKETDIDTDLFASS